MTIVSCHRWRSLSWKEITDAYHDSYNHRVVQARKTSQEVTQSDLILEAGSAIRSGQVAQRFIQSGLKNLLDTAQHLWATGSSAYLSLWG